jgi:glycosyltransferase involved in cell wall biosynthesis
VIRSGIDPAYFDSFASLDNHNLRKQLGIPATARVVGTVMGLTSKKSPKEFLEVCRVVLAAMDDSRVVVVGDGELRLEFEETIRQMGLGKRILLVGLKEDVRPFLGVFDVFLLTSRWEGLPRVLIEALCAGVPIVSTDAGGVSELLPFAPDLSVAKAGSIEHLSGLVLEKLSFRIDRNCSRVKLPEEFHIEHVVREHVRLYSQLSSEKGLSWKPSAG